MWQPNRLFCMFGLPCSGKGTVAAEIQKFATRTTVGIITTSDAVKDLMTPEAYEQMRTGGLFPLEEQLRAELSRRVRISLAAGSDMAILDGCPRFLDQLLWVEREFFDLNPLYIQVMAESPSELRRRAAIRARDEFDTDPVKLQGRMTKQQKNIDEMETYVHRSGLRYYSVINDNAERAAHELCMRIPSPGRRK